MPPAQPQPSGNAGELVQSTDYHAGDNPPNKLMYGYMAPYHLNLCRGLELQQVLSFGRDVWRAALAAQASGEDREDSVRLDWLRDTCCDLRSVNVPTGGDDADVIWVVIEHHMAKPNEREIGRSITDDPRGAIDAARAAAKEGE